MQPADSIEPNDPFGRNPYQSTEDHTRQSGIDQDPRESHPFENLPADTIAPSSPRWWTTIAITGISLALFLIASLIMSLIAMLVVHGELTLAMLRDPNTFQEVSKSRIGLFILIVIPQFALVIPALVATGFSPVPYRRRLGLVRGHWPIWSWAAAATATPLVGLVSSLLVGAFMEESETLRQMTLIFRDHGRSGFLIPLALMIGATPALCEELLFRGYVQTRLTRSMGPAMGIMIASLLFAAFHMDLVHVIAVFPLGLFLGWIAWRSGSLFPAMLGHFVNNVVSVVAVVFAPADKTDVLALPTAMFSLLIIGLGIMSMAAILVVSVVYGRPSDQSVGAA